MRSIPPPQRRRPVDGGPDCPRKRESIRNLSCRPTAPSLGIHPEIRQTPAGPDTPSTHMHYDTRTRAFLRNLSKITRNGGGVKQVSLSPTRFSVDILQIYWTESSFHAPLASTKLACFAVLSSFPGFWAIPCSALGSASRFTSSEYATVLVLPTSSASPT
jgi:hypothetical protein